MENILVLDSGIGGLYTAKILKEKYPNLNYIYFKDTFNCPYGNRSREELLKIALNNINFVLKRFKIKAIVLACNTLSTNVKIMLPNALNVPVLCVEPPINKITQKALVMCTCASYNALKLNLVGKEKVYEHITTLKTNRNGAGITLCAMHNLALFIEKNIKNREKIKEYLKISLEPILNESFNQIVLGCTHYNFVKEELKTVFGNCEFLEGSHDLKF